MANPVCWRMVPVFQNHGLLNMSSLYDPDRHVPLTDTGWSVDGARAEIADILRDIADGRQADGGWPLHPLDRESYPADGTKWALYAGAAGVVIGTEILRRAGSAAPDLRADLPLFHENYRRDPDVGVAEAGLQIGELGILVPAILAAPGDEVLSQRAEHCMQALISHPAWEVTSGQTGMMYAALALYRATGQERWKTHYLAGADALFDAWTEHAEGGGWLWQNRIFGEERNYLGACHGVAGNLNVLLRGRDLLPAQMIETAMARAAETLARHAQWHDGLANWYASAPPVQGRLFMQWCHGAPGIVMALSPAPMDGSDAARMLDELIGAAGQLVWQAGPLKKGAGLCHGTAGNGYAFLAMYRRTGKTVWLDRARAFAAHGVEQLRQHRREFAQARFSLMTGDVGLAVYLHHCLHPAEAAMPGLEIFN